MRKCCLIVILCLSVMFPFLVFASGVVINEVMFDPEGSDTGGEWVELYNSSDIQTDISGWELYPDGIGYVSIPNGVYLGPKKFLLIHLRTAGNNSATDIYQQSASSNMSNTSGSVALFSAEPRGKDTIKSFVEWGKGGETWESSAGDVGLWDKGSFIDIASLSEGNSLALQQDGVASGGKNAWRILSVPTPKSGNTGTFVSSSPLPAVSSSPVSSSGAGSSLSPSSTPHSAPIKTIKAYAGEDISSMVGVVLEFSGHAKGINDEMIDSSARFFWNFGDGETKEGKSVSHTYRIPGTYAATVYVSSSEYTASDYIRVQIRSNFVAIPSVVIGLDGFIRFTNGSDIDVDVSGWSVKDSKGHVFVFPLHSEIPRRGDIAIINSVSGLLQDSVSLPLSVYYPNGTAAFVYAATTSLSGIQSTEKIYIPEIKKSDTARETGIVLQGAVQTPHIVAQHDGGQTSPPIPTASASSLAREERNDYAVVAQNTSPIAMPLILAVGVGALGAIGFFISRKLLS